MCHCLNTLFIIRKYAWGVGFSYGDGTHMLSTHVVHQLLSGKTYPLYVFNTYEWIIQCTFSLSVCPRMTPICIIIYNARDMPLPPYHLWMGDPMSNCLRRVGSYP